MYEVDLSGCGCCTGIDVSTPVQISNLPGLPAIAYRVGTYTQFKHSMQTRLADSELPGVNPLKSRQNDDFSIALLDSWAMVCDVLTFYQERIANESYKRTATERASLLELARLVRYDLQPGVAANTIVAFTLDVTPGSPGESIINIGTKVQSLPGPGEQPQVFETVESIVAQARWNAMKPVTLRTQDIFPSTSDIWFSGTNTNLKRGDVILLVDDPSQKDSTNQQVVHLVQSMQVDTAAQQTHVFFDNYQQPQPTPPVAVSPGIIADAFKRRQPLTDDLVRQLIQSGISQSKLEALAIFQGWSTKDLFANVAAQSARMAPGNTKTQSLLTGEKPFTLPQVFVLRQRASLFGHNAPDWNLMPQVIMDNYNNHADPAALKNNDWPYVVPGKKQLDLDRVYSQIIPDSWIVVERPDTQQTVQQVVQVAQAQEKGASNYALSSKITHLELKGEIDAPGSFSALRQVTVYAQSELLKLVEVAETLPVHGKTITANGVFDGLSSGRRLVVTGELAGVMNANGELDILTNVSATEYPIFDYAMPGTGNTTTLHLKEMGLVNYYKPASVTINANVVPATQGESVQNEILGSGDASQPFQRFMLRQSPLTYVQASNQEGRASTLQIFVNGIQWKEVDTFYGRGPREHIFVTHIENDGKVTIQFGDGRTGTRLPTGEDNVVASYRTGTGTQGLVQPGQISLLKTRPLGVKGVSNPLAPTGAIDPDTIDDARRNADNTVRTLGRIVSGVDYEDFARSYAAVNKASATIIWNNQTRGVYVTIAGPATPEKPAGTEIVQGSGLYNKIYAGMRRASDPTIPFYLLSYSAPVFRVAARIKVHPDYAPEDVLKAVMQSVATSFSFDARNFSQRVLLKEVIAATQKVPGVVTAHYYAFYRADDPPDKTPDPDNRLDDNLFLSAAPPRPQPDGTVSLAELLIIDPSQPFDTLEVMP